MDKNKNYENTNGYDNNEFYRPLTPEEKPQWNTNALTKSTNKLFNPEIRDSNQVSLFRKLGAFVYNCYVF